VVVDEEAGDCEHDNTQEQTKHPYADRKQDGEEFDRAI
jgi:hypothetical protein